MAKAAEREEAIAVAVLGIRVFGDPVLRTATEPVRVFDEQLSQLIDDMFDTMNYHGGAGLAAPQVGSGARVFVYDCGGSRGHIVNPVWTAIGDGTQTGNEGCLSVPGVQARCTRMAAVSVTGVDRNGAPVSAEFDGILARAVQHETDHLDGVLFLARLAPSVRRAAMRHIRGSQWFADELRVLHEPGQIPTVFIDDPSDQEEADAHV